MTSSFGAWHRMDCTRGRTGKLTDSSHKVAMVQKCRAGPASCVARSRADVAMVALIWRWQAQKVLRDRLVSHLASRTAVLGAVLLSSEASLGSWRFQHLWLCVHCAAT